MRGAPPPSYLPQLERIVAQLAERETFTFKDVLPLLTEQGLSTPVAWPTLRKGYLTVVERRTRRAGHLYRVRSLQRTTATEPNNSSTEPHA